MTSFKMKRETPTAEYSNVTHTPVSLDVLYDILCRPRFADTDGEQYVIDTYLMTLPYNPVLDEAGNIWVEVPKADGGAAETLFSAHTDTVHKKTATGTYRLAYRNGMLYVKGGGVLGADDGTGIWIMLNLIAAKVPGTYIFHREEECGGVGSQHIMATYPQALSEFKRAIAFDRRGVNDIITHQGGERCCSDAFAEALAEQLNAPKLTLPSREPIELDFLPDDSGTFTDTKNYTSIIPECTNLAVGYYHQHTLDECQDLTFLTRLVNQLIVVDWESLPTERDPSVVEDLYDFSDYWPQAYRRTSYSTVDAGYRTDEDEMVDLILEDPEGVAALLDHMGYDSYELKRFLQTSV